MMRSKQRLFVFSLLPVLLVVLSLFGDRSYELRVTSYKESQKVTRGDDESREVTIPLLNKEGPGVVVGSRIPDPGSRTYLSPTAIAPANQNTVFVAHKTGQRVDQISLEEGSIIKTFEFDDPVTGVAVNEGDVYVTTAWSQGKLYKTKEIRQKLKTKNQKLKANSELELGFGSCSPVVHPDGSKIYVANQYSNDVSAVDIKRFREIDRVEVLREPIAMAIRPDGEYVFVANLLPETQADLKYVASAVSVIQTSDNQVVGHIRLANGSNALRGIKASPDGKYVFVSHNLGRFQVPTTQLDQGWMNTSAISIIDARKLEYIATVLLDELDYGAAGSWGIECTHDHLYVAHSGTHDFSVIDLAGMIQRVNERENKEELAYDLSLLSGIRERVRVSGNGPRAVSIVDDQLLVATYFSDQLSMFSLGNPNEENERIFEMNPGSEIDSVRMGEIIFHDARHCFQGWQACTGCHPNDGRTDGLNWDLLNDGLGNSKNCKSLVLSHVTAPSMITGIRPYAETAVRAGFKYIQFAEVTEDEAHAVDLYLKSLKPVPSPYLKRGKLTKKAVKGKKIFNDLGCSDCHPAPYYTDLKMHEIGTPDTYDGNNRWDTPTLREVWRTGPYLFDGRCATMKEVFTVEKHGMSTEISDEEVEQLVEYVMSL